MKLFVMLLLAVTVGSCDLIVEPDTSIVVDGVVVEAGTGMPLTRISVQLDRAAFSGPVRPRLAASTTDAQGRFLVQRGFNIDGSYRIFATDLRLFDSPRVGYYRVNGQNDFPVQPGDRKTLRIEMVWQER